MSTQLCRLSTNGVGYLASAISPYPTMPAANRIPASAASRRGRWAATVYTATTMAASAKVGLNPRAMWTVAAAQVAARTT
jgi:hypothetical protein